MDITKQDVHAICVLDITDMSGISNNEVYGIRSGHIVFLYFKNTVSICLFFKEENISSIMHNMGTLLRGYEECISGVRSVAKPPASSYVRSHNVTLVILL